MSEFRSQKQQREQLACSLRTSGASWVEIAATLRQRFGLNARAAFRHAHGWGQGQAAEEWNKRWPDELKTFKAFSYWELWPSDTGHAPEFNNLSKLAELYECAVSDLLVDLPDFRHLDAAANPHVPAATGEVLTTLSGGRLVSAAGVVQPGRDEWSTLSSLLLPRDATPLLQRLHEIEFTELTRVIVVWMQQLNPSVSRRELLAKLSAAGTLAAVLPLFEMLNPEEHDGLAQALQHPEGFDLAASATSRA